MRKVISVRRVSKTPLHHVPDETAVRTCSRRVQPKPRSASLKEIKELPLGDAGLHGHIGQFLAEVHDLIHPAEIEQDTGLGDRNARSIASILTSADRVDSNAELICDTKAFLNLEAVSRTKNGRDGLRGGERCSFCTRQAGGVYDLSLIH